MLTDELMTVLMTTTRWSAAIPATALRLHPGPAAALPF